MYTVLPDYTSTNLSLGASSPRGDKAAVSVVPLKVAEKTTGEVLCSLSGDCCCSSCFVAVSSPLMERTCTPLSGPSDLQEGERKREGVGERERERERERESGRERGREGERGSLLVRSKLQVTNFAGDIGPVEDADD